LKHIPLDDIIVGYSYIFQPNRSINSKWEFFYLYHYCIQAEYFCKPDSSLQHTM